MIVGASVIGVSDALLQSLLVGLVEHNAIWFAQHPKLDPFTWGLRYRPDPVSDHIILHDAAVLQSQPIGSCGTLACAIGGYWRSRATRARVLLRRDAPTKWHAMVIAPDSERPLWDPEKEVPHG